MFGQMLTWRSTFDPASEHHRMAQEPIVRVCVKDRYPVDPFLLLDSVVLGPYPFERGLHLIRMGIPFPETLHNPLCFALPTDAGHAEVRGRNHFLLSCKIFSTEKFLYPILPAKAKGLPHRIIRTKKEAPMGASFESNAALSYFPSTSSGLTGNTPGRTHFSHISSVFFWK